MDGAETQGGASGLAGREKEAAWEEMKRLDICQGKNSARKKSMWLDDSIRCVFSLSPRADGTVPETPLGQKTPVTQHELKMRRQGHYVILPPTNLLNVQSGQKSLILQDVWRWRQICTNVRINNQWKGLLKMGAEHVKSIQTLYFWHDPSSRWLQRLQQLLKTQIKCPHWTVDSVHLLN